MDQASKPTDLADDANGTSATAEAIEGVAAEHEGLLGALARAMHATAASEYERMNAELEHRRTEQVEAIAARASSEVGTMEADISAIDAWAKAETERIQAERLRRIDARRKGLVNRVERQDTIKEREVSAVDAAIATYRNEIDQFFGRIEHEADPAAIARVASGLPSFPPLAEIAEEARRGAAAEFANLDVEAGPAPTAEFANLDEEAAPAPTAGDLDAEASVSQSRLMSVVDPGASSLDGVGGAARPSNAEPIAVDVAAEPRVAEATRPGMRSGSRLLRAIPSIRPAAPKGDPEGKDPGAQD